jgi:Glycosyltransferase family 87
MSSRGNLTQLQFDIAAMAGPHFAVRTAERHIRVQDRRPLGFTLQCLILIAAELAAIFIYGRMIVVHFQPHGFNVPADTMDFRTNAAVALGLQPPLTAAAAGVDPYMYPPPFLFLAAPLAWVSPMRAYLLWNAFSIAALTLAGRAAKFPWPAIALGLITPSVLYCVAIGQTGLIISSLLIFSMALLKTNPLLAGIAAGCVMIKPQLGILMPVCFLASRNWRALTAATLTVVALGVLSLFVFGVAAWQHFLAVGVPLAHATLNRPWPVCFQGIMVTPFIMLRSLGVGLGPAYGLQYASTLAAVAACWYLWRPASQVEPPARMLLTLCLIPLAVPYAYIYDLPGLALALASEAMRRQGQLMVPLVLFWLVTALYIVISMVSFAVGGILLALLAVYVWPRKDRITAACITEGAH